MRLITEWRENANSWWMQNAPKSSHTRIWERQKRTVKNSILNMSPSGRSDDFSLTTVFYEVMAVVNRRHLTVSEIKNPEAIEPLTPTISLQVGKCKSTVPSPSPGEFSRCDLYLRKRWRRVQFLFQQFWSRSRREFECIWYLPDFTSTKMAHTSTKYKSEWHFYGEGHKFSTYQWPFAKIIDDGGGRMRTVRIQVGARVTNIRVRRNV